MVVSAWRSFNKKRFKLWNCYSTKKHAQATARLLRIGRMGGKRMARVVRYNDSGVIKYCVYQRRK